MSFSSSNQRLPCDKVSLLCYTFIERSIFTPTASWSILLTVGQHQPLSSVVSGLQRAQPFSKDRVKLHKLMASPHKLFMTNDSIISRNKKNKKGFHCICDVRLILHTALNNRISYKTVKQEKMCNIKLPDNRTKQKGEKIIIGGNSTGSSKET